MRPLAFSFAFSSVLVKYLVGESHTAELVEGSAEVDGTNEGISDGRKEEEGVEVCLTEGEGLAEADGLNEGLRDGREEEDGDILGKSDG